MEPSSKYYNNDIDNAIYFFSAGKFNVECKVKGTAGTCPGQKSGTTTQLGEVGGFAPTQANIQPTQVPAEPVGLLPAHPVPVERVQQLVGQRFGRDGCGSGHADHVELHQRVRVHVQVADRYRHRSLHR